MMSTKLTITIFVFSVLVFLAQPASAYEIPVNLTKGDLNATVSPIQTFHFNESPVKISFSVIIDNPLDSPMKIYLAEKTDTYWRIITELGEIPTLSTSSFSFDMKFEYGGASTYTGEYAIISDRLSYKSFNVTENWLEYESKAKSLLVVVAFVITPIIGMILIFLLYLISRESERRKVTARLSGRAPLDWSKCEVFSEKIVFVLSNPIIWFVSLLLIFIWMNYLMILSHADVDIQTILQMSLISFVTAFFIPLLLMILTWYGDVYEREPFKYIVGMFVWGTIAAFLAYLINPLLIA
ncbi:MAG: hypothetical protein QW112_01230, partial [Candidatus Micrarchaeia archaeon]